MVTTRLFCSDLVVWENFFLHVCLFTVSGLIRTAVQHTLTLNSLNYFKFICFHYALRQYIFLFLMARLDIILSTQLTLYFNSEEK